MKSIWIIGDVHGCYNTLISLVKKLPKNAHIVFVGDIIDRGKDSQKVIQYIKDNNIDCVKGNHEEMILENKNNKIPSSTMWYKYNGGEETLNSYIRIAKNDEKLQTLVNKIFNNDMKYLDSLPLYIEYKDIKDKSDRYLVVSHSSVGELWKNRNLDTSSEDYLDFGRQVMYSREKDIYDNKNIFNVFGHSIKETPIISKHFANIDTGCFIKKDTRYGNLTALEFPSLNIVTQENIED